MKNFVQTGDVIPLTAPYDVAVGEGAKVGQIFGVWTGGASGFADPLATLPTGFVGEFRVTGVIDIAKATGAISEGALLYWDDTAKNLTTTSAGNLLVGAAAAAAASGDATVRCRLNGSAVADS